MEIVYHTTKIAFYSQRWINEMLSKSFSSTIEYRTENIKKCNIAA